MNTSKYFRISLTDSCNLNCYFCHNEGQAKSKMNNVKMNSEDYCWISKCAVSKGYKKFKLTGGEPSRHPEILDIIKGISSLNVEDLSMITNGFRLNQMAAEYRRVGLKRINVSLYTLDPVKFKINNGGTKTTLSLIVKGIDSAISAGYSDIKLNYVWDGMDNLNDFLNICSFAGERNLTVVLLPILKFNNALDSNEIALFELYNVLKSLGISDEKSITDNEGIKKKIVTLNSGAKVLLRMEELKEKYPYKSCVVCINKNECREGIMPTRLSASGVLYPCLADTAKGISVFNAIKERNYNEVMASFETIKQL